MSSPISMLFEILSLNAWRPIMFGWLLVVAVGNSCFAEVQSRSQIWYLENPDRDWVFLRDAYAEGALNAESSVATSGFAEGGRATAASNASTVGKRLHEEFSWRIASSSAVSVERAESAFASVGGISGGIWNDTLRLKRSSIEVPFPTTILIEVGTAGLLQVATMNEAPGGVVVDAAAGISITSISEQYGSSRYEGASFWVFGRDGSRLANWAEFSDYELGDDGQFYGSTHVSLPVQQTADPLQAIVAFQFQGVTTVDVSLQSIYGGTGLPDEARAWASATADFSDALVIEDITLTDGTRLADIGISYSFAGEDLVPEPASLALLLMSIATLPMRVRIQAH